MPSAFIASRDSGNQGGLPATIAAPSMQCGWKKGLQSCCMRRAPERGSFEALVLLLLVSQFVTGIHFAGFGSALLAALVLGVVNSLVRPILILVTLPITILTLGLFLIVINALMLMLTSALVPGFVVANFLSALVAGVLLGLFNLVVSSLMHRGGDSRRL